MKQASLKRRGAWHSLLKKQRAARGFGGERGERGKGAASRKERAALHVVDNTKIKQKDVGYGASHGHRNNTPRKGCPQAVARFVAGVPNLRPTTSVGNNNNYSGCSRILSIHKIDIRVQCRELLSRTGIDREHSLNELQISPARV